MRVEAFTETTAVLIWTAPGDDGDRGQAAQYDLRVSVGTPAIDWSEAATADATLAPPGKPGAIDLASVRRLAFGQVYYFALRTADGDENWSQFSNAVRVETADPAPPARVTDLRATLPAPHAVTLVFTAPGDDSLSGWAEEYALRMSGSPITEATWDQAEPIVLIDPPQTARSQEHIRITALHPQTTVHLAIRARDDAGRWSDVSNDLEVTLPADAVSPGTITNLELVETSIFTATLRWTAPGNDGDEAKVDGYEIRFAESRIVDEAGWGAAAVAQATVSIVEPGATQTAVLYGLPAPKTLWFAVRATDLAGNRGGLSNGASGDVRRAPQTWVIRLDGTGDAPTVQAGMDSAAMGDTVLVMPGRYYENLDYKGKDIVVRSESGPEATILDGSRIRASVVVFKSGEGHGAVIEGFTITGGVGTSYESTLETSGQGGVVPEGFATMGGVGTPYASGLETSRRGGGVYSAFSEPTIRYNVIRNNSVAMWGGGIYCGGPDWSPRIVGNTVKDNRAGANAGGVGFSCSGEVRNNIISDNEAVDGDGGGIWAWRPGYVVNMEIVGNVISGNWAGDHGGGIYGAVNQSGSNCLIRGNLVCGNYAGGRANIEFSGGGIWITDGSYQIDHNTIVGNEARGGSETWGAGGIAVIDVGTKVIENNIIAYSTYGGGIRCESISTPTIRNNLAWSNVGGDGNGLCADWTSTDGNLAADPLFCDKDHDVYSVAANSPALLHPAGPIGAFPTAGCSAVSVAATPLPVQGLWDRLTWNSAH